ncbi:hypothetical protein CYMTET_32854, partial [Cymbomonas tetramitiformis]
KAAAEVTTDLVDHRCGHDAGVVTKNALDTVGNTGEAVVAMRGLGLTSIAKRTAKSTAKELVATSDNSKEAENDPKS